MIPLDKIIQDLRIIDVWNDRYQYIIELGKKLPPLPKEKLTQDNKVVGCTSAIWLISHIENEEQDPKMFLEGFSDSHIVRGLLYIMISIYSGKTIRQIEKINAIQSFKEIGLIDHLSPQRANGLHVIMGEIRKKATLSHRIRSS
ncbi:SufE family protein [Liberibacter sp. Z1]|nr:SufE family protein [Candidatus Liberibacter sp.]